MRKKLLALTMALLLFFGSFTYPLKVEANAGTNVVEMTGLYHEVINQIQAQFNANVFVDGTTITIIKDGQTYIATDPQGLKEIITTLEAAAGVSAGFLTTFGTIVASSLAFYFTYAATIEVSKALGFTDNATMNGLNSHLVSKIQNPSAEVQTALNEVLFAVMAGNGSKLDIPLSFNKLMFESVRDFLNLNYKPNELIFLSNDVIYKCQYSVINEPFGSADLLFNGYTFSHVSRVNVDTGTFLYDINDSRIAYYTGISGVLFFSTPNTTRTVTLSGFEYKNGNWSSISRSVKLDSAQGYADGIRKAGSIGETSMNQALNRIYKYSEAMLAAYKIENGSPQDIRDYVLEQNNIEVPEVPDFPVLPSDTTDLINDTIDDYIDLFEKEPSADLNNLPGVNVSNSTNASLTAQDIANNESITNIQQDTDYSPQKVPVPDTGTGSGNGNGNENETDDKVNWERLKNIGTAFTNVFPFSIPWDFLRIYKGVFNGTEPKEIHFPYKIAGYDFGITITAQVMSFFGVARILIRLLADLGLLLLVYKWMGAQK